MKFINNYLLSFYMLYWTGANNKNICCLSIQRFNCLIIEIIEKICFICFNLIVIFNYQYVVLYQYMHRVRVCFCNLYGEICFKMKKIRSYQLDLIYIIFNVI